MPDGRNPVPVKLASARAIMWGQALVCAGFGLLLIGGTLPALTTPLRCDPPPLSVDCGSHRGLLAAVGAAGVVLIAIAVLLALLAWIAPRFTAARAVAQTVEIVVGMIAAYWSVSGGSGIAFVFVAVPCAAVVVALGLSGVRQPRVENHPPV